MSSLTLWAAGSLAAIASFMATPRLGRRIDDVIAGVDTSTRRAAPSWRSGVLVATIVLVIAATAAATISGPAVLVLAVLGPLAVAARTLRARWRRRSERARRRSEVIELCDALVAELQAGLSAERVIADACRPWPELAPVVATARLGGDLPGAFRAASQRPGAEGLRVIAACWEVSGRSGAGLASVLDRVGTALREDEEAHAEVRAALGSPRATAKLLAGLPVVGLALGSAMGVDPVSFLLTAPLGNCCLVVGICLALLGVWWVERLALAVEG